MRRKLKNNKGFAMAELLAVSMVILLLFSILFSNYLPLVAEYENRLSYNDVTAEYAGYYVRKMYLTDNNELSSSTKTSINNGIGSASFYKIYDKSSKINNVCSWYSNLQADDKKVAARNYCNNILDEYGVEEIIITNYSMTNVKSKYTESSGKLYKYIKYLPEYTNTIYKGDNDLYRIILKTKDGYATTPIDTDYYTPGSCFVGKIVSGGIEITKYSMSGSDCGSMVTIRKDKKLTMKNSAGKSITGKVVSIGDNAFNGLGVTSINLNGMVKSIGASAFEGSKLGSIDLTGINSIGDRAFKNTQISSVVIPSRVTNVGKEAFASNKKLNFIDINNTVSSEGEFMDSGNSSADSIFIDLGNITKVDNNMFKNFKFSSNSTIVMSKVTSVGDNAFESSSVQSIDNISIRNVSRVGANAFYNLDIKNLVLGKISSIGEKAFALSSSTNTNILSKVDLSSVTELGANAFENRMIYELNLSGSSIITIPEFAFKSCGISNVIFSDKITSVGKSSFEGNSFNNIQLPSSLTNIGVNGFKGNTVITSLNLPASLKKIDSGAFDSWSKLETINNNSTKFNDYDNWCMVVASDDTSCKSEKSDTGYAIGIGDRLINVVNSNGNKISENGGNGNE